MMRGRLMRAVGWCTAGGLIALSGGITGCQQYVSAPGIPSAQGIPENPNKPAAISVMVEAVRYVATRYPPGGYDYDAASMQEQAAVEVPYAMQVCPPRGLRRSFYERLVQNIGPAAQPISPEGLEEGLPTFYVTRVWMRFQKATVDVLRPMPEVGLGPDEKPVYQTVTVRLEGGLEPWRVVHARAWSPNEPTLPQPYFMPDEERIDQFEWQMKQDGPSVEAAPDVKASPE